MMPRALNDYPDVLTPKDVSELLLVDYRTAIHLLHSGSIPYRRIGRQYRILKSSLVDYLACTNPYSHDTMQSVVGDAVDMKGGNN